MTAARGKEALEANAPRKPARLALEVVAKAASVGEARRAVSSFLAANAVPSVVIDDIGLVTSELVTNAVLHPVANDHPVRVDVSVAGDVKLQVANHGSASAIPDHESWRSAPPTDASGRGLGIVRRLCDDVSVRQDGPWAVVACERRLPDHGGVP